MEPLPAAWDWIALWKICHPWFMWAYIGFGLPLRILLARRYSGVWLNRMWLASGAASVLFIYPELCAPVAALPAFAVIFFVAGNNATHSLLMVFPITISVGAIAALIDAALFRFLLQQAVTRSDLLMLFGTNALNVLLAIGTVLLLIRLHPLQVIAILGCC